MVERNANIEIAISCIYYPLLISTFITKPEEFQRVTFDLKLFFFADFILHMLNIVMYKNIFDQIAVRTNKVMVVVMQV